MFAFNRFCESFALVKLSTLLLFSCLWQSFAHEVDKRAVIAHLSCKKQRGAYRTTTGIHLALLLLHRQCQQHLLQALAKDKRTISMRRLRGSKTKTSMEDLHTKPHNPSCNLHKTMHCSMTSPSQALHNCLKQALIPHSWMTYFEACQ